MRMKTIGKQKCKKSLPKSPQVKEECEFIEIYPEYWYSLVDFNI